MTNLGKMFLTTFGLWMLWVFVGFGSEDAFSGGGGALYGAVGIVAAIVFFFPIILGLPLIYSIHGGGFSTAADWKGHAAIAALSLAFASLIVLFAAGGDMQALLQPDSLHAIYALACPLIISWVIFALVMNGVYHPRDKGGGGGGPA